MTLWCKKISNSWKIVNYIILILGLSVNKIQAQSTIDGVIYQTACSKVIPNAEIQNVNSKTEVTADSNGFFSMIVENDDLLTFSAEGFELRYIRINNEKQPNYYIIHLTKTKPPQKQDCLSAQKRYTLDSMEYDQTYYLQMNGSRKGENNPCPGASLEKMSNKNRKRWAFQALYKKWQQEKHIDYFFNTDAVQKITKLTEEELQRFMRKYRPSNEFIQRATENEFLEYIKK